MFTVLMRKVSLISKLVIQFLLLSYSIFLIYGWFLLPGRMQAEPQEQRFYLIPSQTTLKMARQAIRSEDYAPFYWRLFLWNVAGNIAWFLPLGFLLPWEIKRLRRLRNLALFAFLFSLAAESLQYVFAVGIFDIDDVILNTLGAVLGWVGFFYFTERTKRFHGAH